MLTKDAIKKWLSTEGKEWAQSIVVALVLTLIIRTFVIQAFKIPSGSMRPTLMEGDKLFVNKYTLYIYDFLLRWCRIFTMKLRSSFVCQQCGYESPQWIGRCANCDAWSSMVETVKEEASQKDSPSKHQGLTSGKPQKLSEVTHIEKNRVKRNRDKLHQEELEDKIDKEIRTGKSWVHHY